MTRDSTRIPPAGAARASGLDDMPARRARRAKPGLGPRLLRYLPEIALLVAMVALALGLRAVAFLR